MSRRSLHAAVACATAAAMTGLGLVSPAIAAAAQGTAARPLDCWAGAHTLSKPGSRVYPETGNGGYTSEHTSVHLVYAARANRFLAGTHVVLTDQATQCLTSFSLDFERTSVNKTAGPDMKVSGVTVDGHPASFTFVQPTYPGDPNGQDDPNPLAHQASELNPVGGPTTTRCRRPALPS